MELLHFLESIRTPAGDVFFSVCTFFGSQGALIALFALNYWCFDKSFAYEMGSSFFLSGLWVQSLKITLRVPRPFVSDPTLTPAASAVKGATGYSFPSGHTQTSASVLIPAAYEYRRRKAFSAFCVILALLTGFSRLYLGVHTPQDVAAAFLLTAACSAGVIYIRRRFGEKCTVYVSAVLMAFAVFTLIYSLVLYSEGTIDYSYAADSIKSAGACIAFAAGTYVETRYVKFEPGEPSPAKCMARLLFGAAGAAFFLYFLKLFVQGILLIDGLRYFTAILWMVLIYPMIIVRVRGKH